MQKRKVEIFTSGCPICESTVDLVNKLSCPSCEIITYDLNKDNKNTWLIIGMLNHKNINSFLKSLKKYIAGIIAIKIPGEKNAFTVEEISDVCKKLNIFCIKQKNIISAQNYLLNNIIPERILITGSLYLVGKARRLFI